MGALNFRSVKVRKAPGFSNGLKAEGLDKLSPGINIITGPNGSGKSTLARILRKLIWPEKSRGLDIEGNYELDGHHWNVKVESSETKVQRDGIDAIPSGIPTGDLKKVYMLALHELVAENDALLAKRILDDSIGGYNIDLACENLKYSPVIKNRGNEISREYSKAKRFLSDIINTQKELKGREHILSDLERQRDEARKAAGLKDFYVKASAFLKAKQELDNAETALNRFPSVLANIAGNEFEQIKSHEDEIASETSFLKNDLSSLAEKEDLLKELPVPVQGITDQHIEEIGKRIARLGDLENKINECNSNIRSLESQEEEAKRNIPGISDPEGWQGIDLQGLGDIDLFFQDALTALQKKASLEAEIHRLENDPGREPRNETTLREGILYLGKWLKEEKPRNGIPLLIIILISVLGIITAAATYFFGIYGLSGIAAILIMVLWTYFWRRKVIKDSPLANRENDFKRTGLKDPEAWDAENVASRLQELIDELDTELQFKALAKIREGELKSNRQDLDLLKDREEKINLKRDELIRRLKVMPSFPQDAGNGLSTLYIFLDHLREWRTAYTALAAEKAVRSQSLMEKDEELNIINRHFNGIIAGTANDKIAAETILTQISGYERTRRETQTAINNLKKTIAERESRINKSRMKVREIYNILEINDADLEEAGKLLKLFPDYSARKAEREKAGTALEIKRSELEKLPLFDVHKDQIRNLQIYDADAYIARYEAEAGHMDELNRMITEIKTRIDDRMQGDELEKALTYISNAEERLESLYLKNLASLTGDLLVEHLKKETGEENRPEVFRKADSILGRITGGKYQLRVSGEGEPQFIAYDTVLSQGLNLGELSTGTRVQLLLAVRLAFIEIQEKDVKLPLLADELMGNSDDLRAQAIIEALTAVSREGRQVFYFTAQPEEVLKWDSYLKKTKNADLRTIFLKGMHEGARGIDTKELEAIRAQFAYNPPEPGKRNMREYRKLLGIGSVNLLTGDTTGLTLSYLTTDVNLLFRCLKSGVGTWGQLNAFRWAGGRIEGINDQVISDMEKKANLLDQFRELYGIGRPKPVDMEVIMSSEAVTSTFTDAVREKLAEVNGNPRELIGALGTIKRFRGDSIRQLENFLRENNYIDDSTPLDHAEIMIRLQAYISTTDLDPGDADEFLNEIIEE
jgi:uncharacterized protein YhaN